MRVLQFFCLRVFAVVPEQNPQKPTRKKAYSAVFFLRIRLGGSASVPARAGPQKWFCANCKRILRAGGMRGLLELLLGE